MENDIEDIDSTNNAGTPTETAEERLTRIEATNKKLYERAKTAEAEAKALKEKSSISESQVIPKPSDILKADEFKLYRQGYTDQEIDLIMHNGGAKILEDKTSPLVLGLQAAKEQRGAEDAASRATDSSGASDLERKYTETDFRNMSKEDLAKIVPHVSK